MNMGDWVTEVRGIFGRWTKRTLRQPMFLFFALLQPVLFFVLFTQAFSRISDIPGFRQTTGTDSYLTYYSAAVVLQTVLSSSMQAGLGFVQDLESGFMDKMRAAPIRRSSILLGKVMSDGLRIILQTAIIIAICAGLGVSFATGAGGILVIVLMALAFGIAWSGISTFVALATKNSEATFMVSMITTFPLLFLSTAVMPKPLLPPWVQSFAAYNPISYIGDAYHAVVITGFDWGAVAAAFAVCIAVGAVTLSATTAMFKRAVSA
jgi:ABC-2 type transport system permease protein